MGAAKIVYWLIGLFVFLPWLVYNSKVFYTLYKKKKKPTVVRLVIFILVSILIFAGVYSHYRLTISAQAPLVAERAGGLFSQRLEGKLDLPAYAEKMVNEGIGVPGMATLSGEDLERAGFQRKFYDLYISERTFKTDNDNVIMYFKHGGGVKDLYSYVRMHKTEGRWTVIEHNIISQEDMEAVEKKMRFYPVKP